VERRRFVQAVTSLAGGALLAGCGGETSATPGTGTTPGPGGKRAMPEEGEPHQRTWMAFGVSDRIWEPAQVPVVQRNLAAIAAAVSRFEPVTMLVRPDELDLARGLLGDAAVELVAAELDDLWMRDTGPIFVTGDGALSAVDFNFNGWGGKQAHTRDSRVAGFVTGRAGARAVHTGLVLEGGGIEVDGEGTAIITESCVLNKNRNPGLSKQDVETQLGALLGLEKILWLPGIAGHDITDGHTDFYARFAGPGVVVAGLDPDPGSYDHEVTQRHLDLLKSATDARGRPLRVEVIKAPSRLRDESAGADFAAGYINFYVCNGGVIAPEFGDPEADAAALDTLRRLFPDRDVVQLDIDGIAAGGGGIHCTTQQEPARR
jgi:agmatine deiminase